MKRLAAILALLTFLVPASAYVLSWQAADKADEVIGYTIYYSTNAAGPFVQLASVDANTTRYALTIEPGTYYLYVCAMNLWMIEGLPGDTVKTAPWPARVRGTKLLQ